jgi:hypothetical protein
MTHILVSFQKLLVDTKILLTCSLVPYVIYKTKLLELGYTEIG